MYPFVNGIDRYNATRAAEAVNACKSDVYQCIVIFVTHQIACHSKHDVRLQDFECVHLAEKDFLSNVSDRKDYFSDSKS